MLTALKRGGAYAGSIVLSGLVTLISIPVVLSIAGERAWSGIVVAQSVGSVLALVAAFGWGVLGPATVAQLGPDERAVYFLGSFSARLLLAILCAPFAVVAVVVVSPERTSLLVNCLAAFSMLIPALSASWYFVGASSPKSLLLLDSIPRVCASVLGLAALTATRDLVIMVSVQVVGELAIVGLGVLHFRSSWSAAAFSFGLGSVFNRLKSNSSGVVTSAAAAMYVQVPLVVVSSMQLSGLGGFALADKLEKFGLRMLGPVAQVAQGIVPSGGSVVELHRRVRLAMKFVLSLGLIAAAGFACAVPLAADLVTGGTIEVGFDLSVPIGIAMGCVVVTGVSGVACLVALGRARAVAQSTLLGALVGLPLALAAGRVVGTTGVAWSVALAEGAVMTWQIVAISRELRASRAVGPNKLITTESEA